jgi:ubiquinone/menaquinone biosynthesis C-methylase UbiE
VSVNFDRIATRYDETRGGEAHGTEVAAVIATHLPAGGRVLEVGVGTGLVASALDRDVIGIDISAAMLAVARTRMRSPLVRADGAAIPFADDTFAGAYAVWVFHLITDRQAVFAEIRRVLQPDAPCVVELAGTYLKEGDPIQAILGEMYRALIGPVRDTAEQVGGAASEAGFAVLDVEIRHATHQQSPNDVITSIEARSGSAFWRVTDEQWAADVEPALAALRALDDPDLPRPRHIAYTTLILRKR